jgi:hypothetical protein
MVFVGLFGHQQHEQHHRLAVRRVELHGAARRRKAPTGVLQALDAAVRDGDALAEPGGAELFPREQAVEHRAAADALVVLEQHPRLLEDALLAARIEADLDVGRGRSLAIRFMDCCDGRRFPDKGACLWGNP